MRYVENEYGAYYDFCDFPLKDADSEVIATYPFRNPDRFDYEAAMARLDEITAQGFASYGKSWAGRYFKLNRTLMGVEDALVNIAIEDEATLEMVDRRLNMQLAVTERLLDRAKGKIDFMWIGEDLGTQQPHHQP